VFLWGLFLLCDFLCIICDSLGYITFEFSESNGFVQLPVRCPIRDHHPHSIINFGLSLFSVEHGYLL
jgi:hypothetical protein